MEAESETRLNGQTRLMIAAVSNQEEELVVLLTGGADPNLQDGHGKTALLLALEQGHSNCVRALLNDERTNVMVADLFGRISLHAAAARELDLLEPLLARVSENEVDVMDNKGWTPLHVAASQGHEASIQRLLAAGSDPTRPTNAGERPLQLCESSAGRQMLGDAIVNREARTKEAANSVPANQASGGHVLSTGLVVKRPIKKGPKKKQLKITLKSIVGE